MNVVTVDDYPTYSDLIIRYVSEEFEDAVFERFTSAEELLEFLEEDPDYIADVLFCDVEMGGMSGIELARQIRDHYQIGSRVKKMMFVTSYRRLAFDYDGQIIGRISKPFDKADIVDAVYEMTES